jgi:large subunit ribosomal protein L4
MPKKAWRKALCMAISERAKDGKLMVVNSLTLEQPRTKLAKAMLERLGLHHALVVLSEGEESFYQAARNLAAYKVLPIAGLNVFDILNYDELLMSDKSARAIEARFAERA